MIRSSTEKVAKFGKVERRLFDTKKLELAKIAAKNGFSEDYVSKLIDLAAKPMFKENKLWRLAHKLFNVDLQIPLLFGNWTTKAISANLVTTRGKQIIAEQLNGVTTAPVTAIAIGIGTTAANAADTTLESESTTDGTARGAATASSVNTATTKDTAQWVKTFSLLGSFAITEEGLFDNNTSGGNMLARQVFSAVNVVSGDSLQITHKVAFS